MRTALYRISEIPDPTAPRYSQFAGADARPAIWAAAEGFLRAIGDLPDKSVCAVIRFVFDPKCVAGDPQSRLSVYFGARIDSPELDGTILSFLKAGQIGKFYTIETESDAVGICRDLPDLKAACHIYRRDNLVPAHARLNPHALESYYMCDPFVANTSNDYMALDNLLAGVNEIVVVDVAVEPTDISPEIAAHTRYLSRLQAINNRWGDDDDTEIMTLDGDSRPTRVGQKGIAPIRQQDLMADDVRQHQDKLQNLMRLPHVRFHIVVLSQSEATARLAGSVVADAAFQKGDYQIAWHSDAEALKHLRDCLSGLRVCDHQICARLVSRTTEGGFPGLARLPHIATVDELRGAYRLPVAVTGAPLCIRRETDPRADLGADFVVLGCDTASVRGGTEAGKGVPRGFPKKAFAKHVFTSGMPGSGKTTSNLNLLLHLHRMGIPFMVIETAKTEYRALKNCKAHSRSEVSDLARALQVYSPGNERLCPLRFNPLQLLPGVSRDAHIDALKACFLAAMPMEGPMPALLDEGLEQVYRAHSDPKRPPLMHDVLAAVERILREKHYAADLHSNLRGALDVRLGSLTRRTMGHIFQCPITVPGVRNLLQMPTVIELDRLSPEHGCLLSLFLLTAVREYLRTNPYEKDSLRYVVLIEEAHNVVGSKTNAKADNVVADPRAFAAEFITRMLAELRALGIGIVVSDQLPSAVAPEVVKQTTTKLAFRQVAKDDREVLGASMLFGESETEEIARLATGQAFFYTEGYHRPLQITTTNLHQNIHIHPPHDDAFLEIIGTEKWFHCLRASRMTAELLCLQQAIDTCQQKCGNLIGTVGGLAPRHALILAAGATPATEDKRKQLKSDIADTRERLQRLVIELEDGPLAHYMPSDAQLLEMDERTACTARKLQGRFDDKVKGMADRVTTTLDKWLGELDKPSTGGRT